MRINKMLVMLFAAFALLATLKFSAACVWECNYCGCGCSDYFDERPWCREQPRSSCTITFPGGVTGCVAISSECQGDYTFTKHVRSAPPGTRDDQCVGTHAPVGTVNLGVGVHCPRNMAPCGHCVQIDGNGGGVAQYTGDCPVRSYCGDGKKDLGEECDNGANNGKLCFPHYESACTYCSDKCKRVLIPGPYCGDGIIQPEYEECDDGNDINDDYCSNSCKTNEDFIPEFTAAAVIGVLALAAGVIFVRRR